MLLKIGGSWFVSLGNGREVWDGENLEDKGRSSLVFPFSMGLLLQVVKYSLFFFF